jgi:hypothetical protein
MGKLFHPISDAIDWLPLMMIKDGLDGVVFWKEVLLKLGYRFKGHT